MTATTFSHTSNAERSSEASARLNDLVRIWVEQTAPLLAIAEMMEDVRDLERRNQQMAAASEEMAASIREIAQSTAQVSRDAQEVQKKLGDSAVAATAAAGAMTEVSSAFEVLKERMQILSQASNQISQILETIRDIAGKTNILALNATIEAARAGDAGKGFTVVAAEVKNLAEQTGGATREIDHRISLLQKGIYDMDASMKIGASRVSAGEEEIRMATSGIESVRHLVESVVKKVLQVSAATEEQGTVTSDVSANISAIVPVVGKTLKSIDLLVDVVERTGAYVQDRLTGFGQNSDALTVLLLSKADHASFKKRVIDVIVGHGQTTSAELPDHHNCRLGKWYDAQAGRELHAAPEYHAIDTPHQRVHQSGKLALERFANGDFAGAVLAAKELDEASEKIIAALDSLHDKLAASTAETQSHRNEQENSGSKRPLSKRLAVLSRLNSGTEENRAVGSGRY